MSKSKVFKFKTQKAAAVPAENVPGAEMIVPSAEPMYIHGQPAGSSLEWNVAQALDILGLSYQYQYEIGHGRQRRGGRVVDFLVYTPIRPTALMVQGRYWHTGRHADELEIESIKKLMNYQVDVVEIWEENCLTVNDALQFLRQELRTG